MQIRDRIKELRRVKASELIPNPANWRTHPKSQMDAIRGVLAEVGFAGAELAYETDRGLMLIDGHARAEIAGESEIPVLVLDVNEAEAKKILATFDPIGAMAEADAVKLDLILREVETGNQALADMLTELAETNGVLDSADCEIVEDEVPEPPVDPITKPGDLWILGEHRVLCGSCLDMQAMDTLFGGNMARMVFTDPPYNVAYTGKTKAALTIKNDEMNGDDFLQFLRDAFVSLASFTEPGSACYVCHADTEGERFRRAFVSSGFALKQCLVWVKNTIVLGRQDYHWRHEPILYGWKLGEAHRFYANRKQSTVIDEFEGVSVRDVDGKQEITIAFNGKTMVLSASSVSVKYSAADELESVWRFDKPSRNGEHPTMKPIRLVARAISHGSQRGDIVLDGFLGSGSTLIACDQMSRVCYGTELDPKYCDVIVKRWENLTNKKAVCQSATPE